MFKQMITLLARMFFWIGMLVWLTPVVIAAPEAPPANDNFANALNINGASGFQAGTSVAATKETGEPNHAGNPGGASIWYEWTAPSSGAILFKTGGSAFDTLLAIYTGANVNALSEIASNDDCSNALTSCVVFMAIAGTTYTLALDGNFGAAGTTNLIWAAPPQNDNFAEAAFLNGASGNVSGSNLYATTEPDEPNHAGYPGNASVWYQWTPVSAMRVRFAFNSSSNLYGTFAIYTGGAVNALTKVVSSPACGSADYYFACVVFNASAGTTYRIAVEGINGSQNSFQLLWGAPPANDNFANAQLIMGEAGMVSGSSLRATTEPGEPGSYYSPALNSIWYQWTAPADQTLRLTVQSNSYGNRLSIFTGSQIEELVRTPDAISCTYSNSTCMKLDAQGGTLYFIAIDGSENESLTLNWNPLMPPPNDDFADAEILATNTGTVNGTTVDATQEPGEPDHDYNGGTSSVWYAWMATTNGYARIDHTSSYDAVVAVYTGAAVNGLTYVKSVDDEPLIFPIVNGTTYRIAVDSFSAGEEGTFALTWNCPVTNKPVLVRPNNGATLDSKRATLVWQYVSCASHYEVTVRQGSTTGGIVDQNKEVTSNQYRTVQLTKGQTYYWRIKGCSAFQCKTSVWRSFTIAP